MKVLVAADDSPHSEAVVRYITGAPWPKGTTFLVISACEPIFVRPDERAADSVAQLMEEQEKYHEEIAKKIATRLRDAGLIADARVVVGDARTAILDSARSEHADLIIVGSHGRTGIKKLMLGSVASHIVTHAPCSVLVVREAGQHG